MTESPLQAWRLGAGLTQQQTAQLLGCSRSLVQGVETRRLRLTPGEARRWRQRLGLDMAWAIDPAPPKPRGQTSPWRRWVGPEHRKRVHPC